MGVLVQGKYVLDSGGLVEFSIHKLEVEIDVHNDLYDVVFRY